SGLIGGGRLANQLQQSIGKTTIEDLPIRFAAIATEIGTGHEVWLTKGSLSLAVRASYALPGIFPPVQLGGRWLVDGALVNPVPVSAAGARPPRRHRRQHGCRPVRPWHHDREPRRHFDRRSADAAGRARAQRLRAAARHVYG